MDDLADFEREAFVHDDVSHDVFRQGVGPAVVVMPEVPGITPAVAAFARRVAAEGFTVWVPSLFGRPGAPRSAWNTTAVIGRACVSREFAVLARHGASPVTAWLRALGRHAHRRCGGPGIGAVGMCLTGNFALAMMLDDALLAPVLSQPSLPFVASPAHAGAVHLSDAGLARVRERCEAEDLTVLGLRFTRDVLCPAARFDTLRAALGERFVAHEVDSGPANPWGHARTAHSVLTEDLIDEEGQPTRAALLAVLALFRLRLHPADTVADR